MSSSTLLLSPLLVPPHQQLLDWFLQVCCVSCVLRVFHILRVLRCLAVRALSAFPVLRLCQHPLLPSVSLFTVGSASASAAVATATSSTVANSTAGISNLSLCYHPIFFMFNIYLFILFCLNIILIFVYSIKLHCCYSWCDRGMPCMCILSSSPFSPSPPFSPSLLASAYSLLFIYL